MPHLQTPPQVPPQRAKPRLRIRTDLDFLKRLLRGPELPEGMRRGVVPEFISPSGMLGAGRGLLGLGKRLPGVRVFHGTSPSIEKLAAKYAERPIEGLGQHFTRAPTTARKFARPQEDIPAHEGFLGRVFTTRVVPSEFRTVPQIRQVERAPSSGPIAKKAITQLDDDAVLHDVVRTMLRESPKEAKSLGEYAVKSPGLAFTPGEVVERAARGSVPDTETLARALGSRSTKEVGKHGPERLDPVVRLYRETLKSSGLKGVKYYNTALNEIAESHISPGLFRIWEKEKLPMQARQTFIIFDPENVTRWLRAGRR